MKRFSNGIMIDCARVDYTFYDIKKYIDYLAKNNNSFIQLHLTDNENVAIESDFLGQSVENAVEMNGYYVNPDNNKRFFSFEQIRELYCYATSKKVDFIIEIDIPAHMNGFFDLARMKYGDNFVDRMTDYEHYGQIDISNNNALMFIDMIIDEYTEQLKFVKYFHIGYDEYWLVVDKKVDFLNYISRKIQRKGFIVLIWNDGITKDNMGSINHDIEIVYWKFIDIYYASVPDLQKEGFKVIVANSEYLYFCGKNRKDDIMNEWNMKIWGIPGHDELESFDNILGSMVCCWAERHHYLNSDEIYDIITSMYDSMFIKNELI